MEKLKKTIAKIEEIDQSLDDETQKRLDNLTKPKGSLGRLEEIAKRIVGIKNQRNPSLKNKIIFTLAGDHGIVEEGVSAYPQEVTPQMVYNFIRGGAAINVLARHIGARVIVVDMGVKGELRNIECRIENFRDKKINYGTRNFKKEPAMTRDEAIMAIEAGISVVEELIDMPDIIGVGDMGIGNTTPSSAITSVITGKKPSLVTGRGTGVDDRIFENKIYVIDEAIKINKPNPVDAIDVLSKVGGFEIGGICGIILASCANRIPVVIDGFISGAGSLIACLLEPKTRNYIFAGHCSKEPGHKIQLDYLGLYPILDLDMRLGEGTGACLAIGICDASIKILTEMATFDSANVSRAS